MPQEHTIERAVLVGLNADCFSKEETASEASLEELEALLETAGGLCTAKILQNRHTPDARTLIGAGKAEEIRQLIQATEAGMAIFDNPLSPSQIRVLEELLGVTVLDRSALIFGHFCPAGQDRRRPAAGGAGSVQVSSASPVRHGESACPGRAVALAPEAPARPSWRRTAATFAPGLPSWREELAQVRQVRAMQRRQRIKNSVPVVALVGYTNAGKSTLLNQLTGAEIPANNRLFDTLDTTSRQLEVNDTLQVILSDTVGFISSCPTTWWMPSGPLWKSCPMQIF